ncbi:signal peptidase I (plasmid) [Vibrio sp. SS-MA-C1-2]|uniref:signal peptidase I n=1 Tax=Vibrio sp. SS-MA-C1-2 TaxID=2908646 RepID=UPI001F221D1E|nr:signal peptidase I [Vibrio sp. SS-MA-C1-2]UJF20233.1 signal peptidase I [Vibrio sp. SS-MA-C1-2]
MASEPQLRNKILFFITCFLIICLYLFSRYSIAFTGSKTTGCLPVDVALIDNWNTSIKRGQLIYFRSENAEPLFANNTKFLKIAAALEGDQVTINKDSVIVTNRSYSREYAVDATRMLNYLNWPLSMIEKTFTVEVGQVFALGTLPSSFDSRYWGTVSTKNIEGVAYAIY